MRSQRATVLHPLAGRPMAVYPTHTAQTIGCSPLVIACSAKTAQLQDYVGCATACNYQDDGSWLDAMVAAVPETVSAVLVVAGTMPLLSKKTMSRLIQRQHETSCPLVLLTSHHAGSPHCASIVRDSAGRIERILTENDATPAGSPVESFSTGVMCFSREWLWEHRDAALGQEECLVSLAALAVAKAAKIGTVRHAGADVELLQVEDRADLALAESALRERIRGRAMRRGVTLVDPATVWIDDSVKFGRDVTLWPNCYLYGDTAVGDYCTIGPGTRLHDTRLAANVTVMESVLEGVEAGENVRIGPFAHLRPGTVVADDVEIGNYAELKNTQVNSGAKIHHVGYLGDTVVGNDVNVGAGTITCNFDGADKHETEIGDGAFIGSGTLLVAPVRVGSNALTGAGSVVTRDVPAQAKAYGVPARVRGMRGSPAESEQDRSGEGRES